MKRIITRPDFDGVVCAVLLKSAISDHLTILWAQPNQMQNGKIAVTEQDIIANLPHWGEPALWFDHHVSNSPPASYKGLYRVAPSAAGLVYEYYQKNISDKFQNLVQQADKIDDAQLNLDEILHPENHPYILLSMTIFSNDSFELDYCDILVDLLLTRSIDEVLVHSQVNKKCTEVLAQNKVYEKKLLKHTQIRELVSITDFRGLDPVPNGNRFLIYSLYPETVVNIKIFHEDAMTVVKIGHSILNRNCNVNVGKLLSQFGGGGHRGAGACRFDSRDEKVVLKKILHILIANEGKDQ